MPQIFEYRALPHHLDILVLSFLDDEVSVCRKTIISNLYIPQAECTRILTRLEAKGLIVGEGKKKWKRWRVTDSGLRMLDQAKRIYEEL